MSYLYMAGGTMGKAMDRPGLEGILGTLGGLRTSYVDELIQELRRRKRAYDIYLTKKQSIKWISCC